MDNEMQRHYQEMEQVGCLRDYRRDRTATISIDFIRDLFNTSEPPKLRLSLEADMDSFRNEVDAWQVAKVKLAELGKFVRDQACRL